MTIKDLRKVYQSGWTFKAVVKLVHVDDTAAIHYGSIEDVPAQYDDVEIMAMNTFKNESEAYLYVILDRSAKSCITSA